MKNLAVKKTSAILVTLFLLCALGVVNLTQNINHANAEDKKGTNITLSPAVIEAELKPGDHKKDVFQIMNNGSEGYNFTVSVAPYSVAGEDYDPVFTQENERTKISDWVKFPEGTSFELEPNQTKDVPYEIDVPKEALGGGQYAVLFAQTTPKASSSGGAGVSVSKRVGGLLFAKIEGDTVVSGKVFDQKIEFWSFDNVLEMSYRAINDGNVDSPVTYSVDVKPLFSSDSSYKKTNETKKILPGTTRLVPLNWEDTPTFGIYNVSLKANFNGQSYDKTQLAIICPWWVLLIIVIVIVLIVFLTILMKVRKSKAKRKNSIKTDASVNDPQISSNSVADQKEFEEFKKWKESQNAVPRPKSPENQSPENRPDKSPENQ